MGHRLLLSLPAAAAAIVAWAVLSTVGARVQYVQVLGGPTATVSSVLIRSLELDADGTLAPSPRLALRVVVQSGSTRELLATTDDRGQLELRLDGDGPPVVDPWLRVESQATSQRLAEGRLSLTPERWRGAARRSGGWLSGQTRGALRVRVAAESGTFAVPFESALMLQVLAPAVEGAARGNPAVDADSSEERPVAGAQLELELTGAALAEPPPPSGAMGLSRVLLHAREHAVSARVVARAGARQGEWYGMLPVTPGALAAALDGSELLVRSPIVRERAFASIVSADERIAGAIVLLSPDSDGGASGRVVLAPTLLERIEREPTWAVVSSEHDKRSSGTVGWPLRHSRFDPAIPTRTYDVADSVLLDGRAGAIHAAQLERSGRRRGAALALLVVGVLMGASFWRQVRRAKVATAAEQSALELPTPLTPGGWVLAAAIGCIVLALGGLAYFGLVR